MMKKLTLWFVAAMLGLSFSAAMAQDKTYTVGISLPEAQNPFYILLGKAAVETFRERGNRSKAPFG